MTVPTRSLSAALIAGLGISTAANCQVQWQSIASTGAPPPFCGHAWDVARGRLVAFGGLTGSQTVRNTTIEWTGTQWVTRTPLASPPARSRVAMAYDAARGSIVMFGGFLSPGFANDTWGYDGTTWTQLAPANAPSSRYAAAMTYDTWRQVVVLHGGFVPAGTDAADLWIWDGTNWSQPSISGPSPSARGAHRMAFDDARGVAIVHGGYSSPLQSTVADSWSWDGFGWTQLPGGPGSLCDEVLAYDEARQRVVLFGGLNVRPGVFTDLNQTWEWTGTAWQLRSPVGAPSARSSSANAYDALNRRVLVAGGTSLAGTVVPTDTWSFTPTQPATTGAFGTGCDATTGPIRLDPVSLPYLGSGFVQRVSSLPPVAPFGEIAIGFSNTNWNGTPLPADLTGLGATGCTLHVSLDLEFYVFPVQSSVTLEVAVPNQGNLLGMGFFAQAAVVEPASPRPLPVAFTAARFYTIGSP